MSPAVQSALVSGFFLVLVALIVYRQTRKGEKATSALQERVVNRQDFEAFMDEARQSIAALKADLEKVRGELKSEIEARKAAEKRADDAERRAAAAERRAVAAERRVTELTRRVAQLEDELGASLNDLAIAKAALAVAVHDEEP